MKDKLRELAGMVREAYRAGFIAACKWPEPVSQDVDSYAYNKEFNDWSFSVREKHAAILDAEGDGGAVANDETHPTNRRLFTFMCAHAGIELGKDTIADATKKFMLKITPHPARSGVVSDEDVDRCERLLTACTCHADFKDRDMVDPQCCACELGDEVIDTFRAMRSAIQGERHER